MIKQFFILNFILFYFALHVRTVVSSKVVGCYYGSWAGYRSGNGKLEPENIDTSLCTHIYYSFVGITSAGGIRYLDEWNDIGKDYIGRFNALKKENADLKTLVAIGGWNEESLTFSKVANDATLRKAFAQNAADFVQKHGFDGFDLDWEYPAQRGGAVKDYEGFILMMKEMRSVFDKYGLLLTAAVGITRSYVGTSYNVAEMSKYLDYINLMAYDFRGSWESFTGHNAPLYKSNVDVTDADLALNVDSSVRYWIQNGALANKLVLGVGTYGRSFTLVDSSNTAIGAPSSGPGDAGPHTQEKGNLGYNEICSNINNGWQVVWDDNILAPYAYKGNQWVGYDNARSAQLKAEYAKDLGLAGTFIWSLETEDFTGNCGDGKNPILRALNVINSSNGNGNDSSSSSVSSTTLATPTMATESTTHSITTDADIGIQTTTTRSKEICSSVGYTRDPTNCQTFYYCQADGQNGFIAHKFSCFGDLVYDEKLNQCNYKDQVPECN